MENIEQKRPREGHEDDDNDRPKKIPRLTNFVDGPNWWMYPQDSRTPISFLPDGAHPPRPVHPKVEKMESPPINRRIWHNYAGNSAQPHDWEVTPQEKKQWLASNPQWQHGLNYSWVGKKVLGRGGYGLVGLWECTMPNNEVKKVVVKQSRRRDNSLRMESDFLRDLNTTGTRHVVKLLKRYHEEVGMGTSPWDSDKQIISRIYLEHCEYGDMKGMIKQIGKYYGNMKTHIPEEYIWAIWECLARGLCVMQNGNENLDGPRWARPEIVHFDIKPHNILIGKKDNEHTMMGAYKFADFGLALYAPAEQSNPIWLHRGHRRGTHGWLAPEQTGQTVPNHTIGTPVNVWTIARIMLVLIRRGRLFNSDNHFICHLVKENMLIETYGRKILRPEFDVYSDPLRSLILRCLARNPKDRPSPRSILHTCQMALKAFIPTMVPFPGIPPDPVDEELEEPEGPNSAYFSSSGFLQSSPSVSIKKEEESSGGAVLGGNNQKAGSPIDLDAMSVINLDTTSNIKVNPVQQQPPPGNGNDQQPQAPPNVSDVQMESHGNGEGV